MKIKGYFKKPEEPKPPELGVSIESVYKVTQDLNQLKSDFVQTADTKIAEVDQKIEEIGSVIETGSKKLDDKIKEIEDVAIGMVNDIRALPKLQGPQGEPGTPADEKKIIDAVVSKVTIDESKLINRIIAKIPENKASLKVIQETFETDPMSVIDKILSLPEEKLTKLKLKTSNIDGLDQTIRAFQHQIGTKGYIHGGGDTVTAGTNITITTNANGQKVISSSAGASQTLAQTLALGNTTGGNDIIVSTNDVIKGQTSLTLQDSTGNNYYSTSSSYLFQQWYDGLGTGNTDFLLQGGGTQLFSHTSIDIQTDTGLYGFFSGTGASKTGTFDFSNLTNNKSYVFPNNSGTIALTSDITGGTLAGVSTASTDATKSLYTMTSTIPVEFKTSDSHTLLYLDETNERVGINTNAPGAPLTVNSNSAQLRLETNSDPVNYYSEFFARYDGNAPFKFNNINAGVSKEIMGLYYSGSSAVISFKDATLGVGTAAAGIAKLAIVGYGISPIVNNDLLFSYDVSGNYRNGIGNVFDGGTAVTNRMAFFVCDTSTTGQVNPLNLYGNNVAAFTGKLGVGVAVPTAILHLKAGTATAGTAPLKINSGTVLGTTEGGAIENDGTHLYYTAADGGTRYQLDQQSGGTGLTWAVVTVDGNLAINTGTLANKGTLLTLTLPTTAAVGSVIRVAGMNAGLWKIAQNASGVIHFGNQNTTTGVGGSLASTLTYDAVELVCSVANNEWVVTSSIGAMTVV